jgi:hypothetical protein
MSAGSKSPRASRKQSPAKSLFDAKNRLGDYAVEAAERDDHRKARRFAALALEADTLAQKVIEEMARAK